MNLVYCATPARLSNQKHNIMEFVINKGKAPLQPFNALPIEYFETPEINRADTLALCCKLVDACDEFWIFGISEGTLTEAEYFFKKHQYYAKEFRARFDKTLAKLML